LSSFRIALAITEEERECRVARISGRVGVWYYSAYQHSATKVTYLSGVTQEIQAYPAPIRINSSSFKQNKL
jgi:hypothetical protein